MENTYKKLSHSPTWCSKNRFSIHCTDSTQDCRYPDRHSQEIWACSQYCNSCTAAMGAGDRWSLALAAFTGVKMTMKLKTPQILLVSLGNRNHWMGSVIAALPCPLLAEQRHRNRVPRCPLLLEPPSCK